MNKKVLILSILVVLMLVTISYAAAVENKSKNEKKESPLYKIRTKNAIGEKIGKIIAFIKIKFLGEKIFLQPINYLIERNGNKYEYDTEQGAKCQSYHPAYCATYAPHKCTYAPAC